MRAEQMIPGKRYKTIAGNVYKAIRIQDGKYLAIKTGGKVVYSIDLDYEVEHVWKGQGRVSDMVLKEVIDYIKTKYDWFDEKKAYIKFLKNNVHFKLYYGAQKVLIRNPIEGVQYTKKYANKYYAYKLSDIKDYIMDGGK